MADSYTIWIRNKSKRVPFWTTCSKYFVIVPTWGMTFRGDWVRGSGYCITHRPSKRSVARHIRTRTEARLIAGALAGIPVKWADLTNRKKAVRVAAKLPKQISSWLGMLVKS